MTQTRWLVLVGLLTGAGLAVMGRAADVKPAAEFAKRATWAAPAPATVRQQAMAWLESRQADTATLARVEALWSAATAPGQDVAVLDVLAATLAAGDPAARALTNTCAKPRDQIALPDLGWLSSEDATPFERNNLRLLYGRWLVQEMLYDEAAAQLGGLQPDDVVDPASLLFYQAVVEHRMLDRKAGLATIGRLLEQEATLPRRYTSVARLMQADLESLEDESLDHVARRMEDIRRRLDLGRAGPKVLEVEDGVIASLDKMIDQLEKARQEQHKARQEAAKQARERMQKNGDKDKQKGDPKQKARPDQPLDDSRLPPDDGEGAVDNKPIGNQSGWGNMPEHKRAEALQQIGQEFPAHYRDMIEQYFRRMAAESEEPNK